jgi:dynein heavy chain
MHACTHAHTLLLPASTHVPAVCEPSQEYFLEDLNNILNTGDVPNLLDDNDVGSIINSMRPIAQAQGLPQTKVALYNVYVGRVRANLHMSICMSPLGEAFRTRLRNFPSLVNNCTIDYFAEWPEEALRSVAKNTLDTIDLATDVIKEGVVQMCGRIHQSVEQASRRYLDEQRRYNYVTPTSYLEVLSTFKILLGRKREEVGTAKRRLVVGLDKLSTTEVVVDELKKQIEEMKPVLTKTSAEVEEMMIVIAKDNKDANATQ